MNRGERRRESRLGRAQSIDLEGIRNNSAQALQSALNAIDANVRQQRFTKARKMCDSALAANPQSSQLHYALGVVHQARGDTTRAVDAYQKAVSINTDYLAAWINLGICARSMKDPDTAVRALEKAISIDPKSFHAHYNLGLVYCDLKRMDAAVAALSTAVGIVPKSPEARFQLGFLHELQKQYDKAISHYAEALAVNPTSDAAHTRIGTCLQIIGRFREAADHLQRAIDLNPANGRAQFLLASSAQAQTDAGFTARLEAQTGRRDIPAGARIDLHFAAGRLLERTGNYDRAFAQYKAGNEMRNVAYEFDDERLLALAERIKSVFTADYFAKHSGAGDPTERPVFVIGIPRSGTTLVEQIIAAHPQGFGAGELSNLPEACSLPGIDTGAEYPECMADLDSGDFATMAERYIADLPPRSEGAAKVVDKTPGNAMWLGMIAAMFPNAAIIHCDRDPMDTLWSCYAQNFFSDVFYACDLDNLAAYHTLHNRTMQHWQDVLPVSITRVAYEDLVSDPGTVIPRIIAAAGLEWDDRCLDFHSLERSVETTSLWQVRQPMFRDSVGKWKNFENHLGPLKAALERYGASTPAVS